MTVGTQRSRVCASESSEVNKMEQQQNVRRLHWLNTNQESIPKVEIERDTTDMLIGNSFVGFLMTIFAFSGLVFFFESESPAAFHQKFQLW